MPVEPEVDGGSCSRPSPTLFIKQVSTLDNWIASECPVSTFRELGLQVGHHAPGIYVLGIQAQVLTFAQKMLHPRSHLPNLPLRLLREDAQMDQGSSLISDIFSL